MRLSSRHLVNTWIGKIFYSQSIRLFLSLDTRPMQIDLFEFLFLFRSSSLTMRIAVKESGILMATLADCCLGSSVSVCQV